MPFVYLRNPTGQGVGPYATIPVLGATNWAAPSWLGLPVQWCGLVYADALDRLADQDPAGPWRVLADGIAASGIQQTYPATHPHRGLLPDSFNLNSQSRNPADINPGTLQPLALRMLGVGRAYDCYVSRTSGVIVQAPGAITEPAERAGAVTFTVAGWTHTPAWLLIHGLEKNGAVRIHGQPAAAESAPESPGTRIVPIQGRVRVEVVVGTKGS